MRVILVMVSSIDGKIIKWEDGNTYKWTSRQDKSHFESVIRKNTLIVMGSKTFEVARPKPKEGTLRIVLTSDPRRYAKLTVPGLLEFTSEGSTELIGRLEKQGFKELLLVGGSGVNTSFFQQGLIDELWLTIEPRIFGKGKMIVIEEEMDINLKLYEVKKLNAQGSLLLKYKVT